MKLLKILFFVCWLLLPSFMISANEEVDRESPEMPKLEREIIEDKAPCRSLANRNTEGDQWFEYFNTKQYLAEREDDRGE